MNRADRSHARWPTAAVFALALFAAMVAVTPARAVTIGQVAPSPPPPACTPGFDYLQPSVTGGNLYIARQAGTLTSWSTRSSTSGSTYVFKVFRRTGDPDVFQAIAHAPQRTLSSGLNTFAVSIPVRSGDMIGIQETGPASTPCTFAMPGDGVLRRMGSLADGATGPFSPQNDVRLNLSAVLVPSNDFTINSVTRDRKVGTATLIASVSNPGLITISGKGLKKRHATKTVAVAGTVQFQLASAGAAKRKLEKTGKATVIPTLTFTPTGGNAASQTLQVRLKKRRPRSSVQSP